VLLHVSACAAMTDQDSNAPQGLPSVEQLAAIALARFAYTAIT